MSDDLNLSDEKNVTADQNPLIPERGNGTSLPPIDLERNQYGLYKHMKYQFKENGKVDWRKMINPEYIVPNKERTSETDITKLQDQELLIKLFGFRELAQLRGFESCVITTKALSPEFVQAEATITWIPNFESENREQVSTGLADANPNNTNGFSQNFLTAIAENRAFVRAVRNYLGIPIVGQDEVGGNNNPPSEKGNPSGKPIDTLKGMLASRDVKFESFKNVMIKKGFDGAPDWNSVDDIDATQVFELIQLLTEMFKKSDEKKAAKTTK